MVPMENLGELSEMVLPLGCQKQGQKLNENLTYDWAFLICITGTITALHQ